MEMQSSDDPLADLIVVDVRPFMVFNGGHIRRSVNLNCSDRWNRKRLQMGKASLADLVTGKEGKDLLRRRSVKEVIVYDDGAVDCERLPSASSLYIVLSALLEDNKEPILLAGQFYLTLGHMQMSRWLCRRNWSCFGFNGDKLAAKIIGRAKDELVSDRRRLVSSHQENLVPLWP